METNDTPKKPHLYEKIGTHLNDAEQIHNKINDRKRGQGVQATPIPTPPTTPTQQSLAEIWADFLGLEQIGIHDNFFQLGGHSLMATQILSRVRKDFQVELPINEVFADVFTIARLANLIENHQLNNMSEEEMRTILDDLEGLSDEEVKVLFAYQSGTNAVRELEKQLSEIKSSTYANSSQKLTKLRQAALNWFNLASTSVKQLNRNKPKVSKFTIAMWPPVKQLSDLAELVPRLEWALPNIDAKIPVIIFLEENLSPIDLDHLEAPIYLARWPNSAIDWHFQHESSEFRDTLEQSAIIAVWHISALVEEDMAMMMDRVVLIDPDFYATVEPWGWYEIIQKTASPQFVRNLEKQSQQNFSKLMKQAARFNIANVFGTGPNLQKAYNYEFTDHFNIICNSGVKSDLFLENIKPSVIACMDPVVRLGPSLFAARFRQDLVKAVQKHHAFVIVPAGPAIYLLASHYPELQPYLIGVDIDAIEITIPTSKNMRVRPSNNVLTMLMLPIAFAIQPKVTQIWGCDGGDGGIDSTWQYNPLVQYGDRKEALIVAHPAFFRDSSPKDITEEHYTYLEELLVFADASGFEIRTCSTSSIPSLAKREATPINRQKESKEL